MAALILDAKTLIKNANDNIENNIRYLCPDHVALCAQNILGQTRNLLDAIFLLKHRMDVTSFIPSSGNEAINKARSYVKGLGDQFIPFLKLYSKIEIIASHYTQNLFDSESLLFGYAEMLHDVKEATKNIFGIEILKNLDDFPFSFSNVDYYQQIKDVLLNQDNNFALSNNTFYIEKKIRRPFGLFEYVLSPANDSVTKFDRLTAFSVVNIKANNAIRCAIDKKKIEYNGITIVASFISSWSISVRPCELNKLAYIIGLPSGINRSATGYASLMSELTSRNISLFDYVVSDDFDVQITKLSLKNTNKIYLLLTGIYSFIKRRNEAGRNTVKYLLYICRHSIIKSQISDVSDEQLGKTCLSSRCYAFDSHPFSFSLLSHNPRLDDLLECLPECCTKDELLKRALVVNTEDKKKLYTPIKELDESFLTRELAETFNSKLVDKTKGAAIKFYDNKYAYIDSYESHTVSILKQLIEKSKTGDLAYEELAKDHIKSLKINEIDEDKINILKNAFIDSSVVLINGAAGTGKTTLIKHFASIFKKERIIVLSCTNSSVQNLKIKVGNIDGNSNMLFMTLDSFKKKSKKKDYSSYKILVVDECSMAENNLFDEIISNNQFEKMILVGDEKQIESIRFGNWFGIANKLINNSYELSINHRTNDYNLSLIWDEVRSLKNQNGLAERIVASGYHSELSNELFKPISEDEVILCLNYDGLYGINNINRYMQELNTEKGVSWKVWTFKKKDRIIFNESYYFRDFFYNNQKGIIEDIDEGESFISFDVSVEHEETNNKAFNRYIQFLESKNNRDYYRIIISKEDDDDESGQKALIVPFQLGYAISIHKSQGLEFESVKVVLTKEVEEQISHNIFYTAITRSKKYLKLFCDKTSLSKIINSFKQQEYDKDSIIISDKYNLS